MRLELSTGSPPHEKRAVVHSIEGLTLNVINESLLYDGEIMYVLAYDEQKNLVGEMSVTLENVGRIENVWIHPTLRNNVLFFKMAQMLKSNISTQHFEAHVRDYTRITPDVYSGRLGLPRMLRSYDFYEYFLAPSFEKKKYGKARFSIPGNKRSMDIHQFENGMIVEDYAYVYYSTDLFGRKVLMGHINDFILPDHYLHQMTQYYDYLNFRTLTPLGKGFNIVKSYKTTVFRSE